MADPLVEVNNLKKYFVQNDGLIDRMLGATQTIKAVNGISFDIYPGETLGLVGESGSGKSTAARAILHLDEPTDGSVIYDGTKIGDLSKKGLKDFRKQAQMVFQDPASSLNRRKSVGQIIKQPMRIHNLHKGERDERVNELMETVGIPPQYSNRYPHEFSGGQRQRVGIARALAVEPDFLVCDEPVSALDVSIQAQILNLLEDLQEEFNLTMLFIAHDMSVIQHICDRVAVLYLGEVMELAKTEELFENPRHPYTRSLLQAIPEPDPTLARNRKALKGQVPSPIDPPTGCVFHTRCPEATEECSEINPPLEQVEGTARGHTASCLYADEFESESAIRTDTRLTSDRYSPEEFNHADRVRPEGDSD